MSPEFKNEPPKAHLCSLYDIIPAEDEWTDEATHLVLRLIDQNNINMFIMKIIGEQHYVDLLTNPTDCNELSTSVRDALILLEHGCFVNSANCPAKVSLF